MLYYFLFPFANQYTIFNLFKYITFRTGGAVITSLIFAFITGPFIIRKLKNWNKELIKTKKVINLIERGKK